MSDRLSDERVNDLIVKTTAHPEYHEVLSLAREVQEWRTSYVSRGLSDLNAALNELVSELTKHADALRATVLALVDQQAPDDFWRPIVDAYDNFVREA